jgi:hypothetical protein
MDYKQKYLKYKQKYLFLKTGGNEPIIPYINILNELQNQILTFEKYILCCSSDVKKCFDSIFNISQSTLKQFEKFINVNIDSKFNTPETKYMDSLKSEIVQKHLQIFIRNLNMTLQNILNEINRDEIIIKVKNIHNYTEINKNGISKKIFIKSENVHSHFIQNYWIHIKNLFDIVDKNYSQFYKNIQKEKCLFLITRRSERDETCDKSVIENCFQMLLAQQLIRIILPISELCKIYKPLYEKNEDTKKYINDINSMEQYLKNIVIKQNKYIDDSNKLTTYLIASKLFIIPKQCETLSKLNNSIIIKVDEIINTNLCAQCDKQIDKKQCCVGKCELTGTLFGLRQGTCKLK